jgi:hypothetical protein
MNEERGPIASAASSSFGAPRATFVAAVALIQVWLGHRYFGFLTGDDLEVIEEAFRRVRHIAFTPWDVRGLFVPDVVIAPMVWLATRLGVQDVGRIIEIASLPSIALMALTIVLVRRLALQWSDGDERAATIAMLLFGLHWIPLGFGSTTYPRTLAMACIVGAALLAERMPLLAGALVGLAFADRFSEIVFLLPLLVAARRRWWRLLIGAIVSISITVGIYDWVTWGSPFSSAIKFAHLTLVEPDFASRVKYQSPIWYLTNVVRWLAPTLLPLLWIARKRAPWLFVLVPLIALSIVKHKELRYVQGMIPFIAVIAGIGASMLWRERRALAMTLVGISLLWNLAGLRFFARKTQPAVMAARWLATQPVKKVVLSQLWAYGDRLYLGTVIDVADISSPPQHAAEELAHADAAALWETDLDDTALTGALTANGFHAVRTFRDGPARAVVVFRRPTSASGTLDPTRR